MTFVAAVSQGDIAVMIVKPPLTFVRLQHDNKRCFALVVTADEPLIIDIPSL
jgi:hypothetical protein